MILYIAALMFILAFACGCRSIIRDESMNAAGLFALAGCVLLK